MDKIRNKKILIVGGTGYIGTELVKYARSRDFNITCIGLTKRPVYSYKDDVDYYAIDTANYPELLQIKDNQFHYVINASGYVNHSSLDDQGGDVIRNHLLSNINLCKFLCRQSLIRYVALGSGDEYGNASVPHQEDAIEMPASPYAFAKYLSSNFLRMMYRAEKFPAVVLRLYLVYGPHQSNNRIIPQIINACIKNETLGVTKGEQVRDFCYIDDVVSAIYLALEKKGIDGEIFNIASGGHFQIREIIDLITENFSTGNILFGAREYRKNEILNLYPSIEKARNILGWRPEWSITKGVKKTIESYVENKL